MESLLGKENNTNLDDIINQITNNGEFKQMMTQITDELGNSTSDEKGLNNDSDTISNNIENNLNKKDDDTCENLSQ